MSAGSPISGVIRRCCSFDVSNAASGVSFSWCRYLYDDGSIEHGYRFIWVTPEGRLQPARGQARLPSLKIVQELMAKAKAQGWGSYDAEVIDTSSREDASAYCVYRKLRAY